MRDQKCARSTHLGLGRVSSKVDAKDEDIMGCDEFYSEVSIEGMSYICHLIDKAPATMESVAGGAVPKELLE